MTNDRRAAKHPKAADLKKDREAGLDQRAGNESRDIGDDAYAASHESVSAADAVRGQVAHDDREQQADPKTGEALGIEVRRPSDGAEPEVDPEE